MFDEPGEDTLDLATRRPEVLQRLLERGVPARTLQTLFPGWELPQAGVEPSR